MLVQLVVSQTMKQGDLHQIVCEKLYRQHLRTICECVFFIYKNAEEKVRVNIFLGKVREEKLLHEGGGKRLQW